MSIVTNSELDLFARPPIQTSVEHGSIKDYYPVSGMIQSGPLEFTINSSAEDYLDLSSAFLYITAHISDEDVEGKEEGDRAAPVNNWIHSLFSQVDVSVNGKLISSSSNTYGYRSYLETLLSFGKSCKETFLTNGMWYKDTAGELDSSVSGTGAIRNKGAQKRMEFTAAGRKIDLIGYIHDDLFRQHRLLPPGVTVKVRFLRARDSFSLISAKSGYKALLSTAIMYVRKVKINPSVTLAHANVLKKNNMMFPINRVECKVFSVSANSHSAYREGVISGQLPSRIVIGCVRNDAFNGIHDLNPFNFQHFDLNHLRVHVDGQPDVIPSLQPDFENNLYVRSFHSLFGGIGKVMTDEDFDLNRSEYPKGFALYAFNLSTDSEDAYDILKSGSIRIDMKFAKALPQTINVIVYAEFQNIIQIDSTRNVVLDWAN